MDCAVDGCRGRLDPGRDVCTVHRGDLGVLEREIASGPFNARGVRFRSEDIALLRRALSAPANRSPLQARFDTAVFDDDLTLAGVVTGGELSFVGARFEGALNLADAHVAGPLRLTDAHLAGTLLLNRSRIDGVLVLRGGRVGGIDARRLRVNGPTNLVELQVERDASFNDATFAMDASFGGLSIGGGLLLQRARFDGGCSMAGARLRSGASLHDACFAEEWRTAGLWSGGDLDCHGVRFAKVSGVGKAQVNGLLNFHESVWETHVSMDVRAHEISFEKAEFHGGFDLITDSRTDLSQVRMGAGSRVRGGLFWEMDDGCDIVDAESDLRLAVITNLRGTDVEGLILTQADLSLCQFAGAHNLDKLRFDGVIRFGRSPSRPWWRWTARRTVADEHHWREDHGWSSWALERSERDAYWADPDARAVEAIYRSLRKGQEDAKDAPGAADLYYGEMEMRRHAGRDPDVTSGFVESRLVYAYWLLAGYGLRASRALTWLSLAIVAGALVLHHVGFSPERSLARSLVFSAATAVTFGAAPAARGLTTSGEVVRLALRVLGPILVGLAALAVRGRVRR